MTTELQYGTGDPMMRGVDPIVGRLNGVLARIRYFATSYGDALAMTGEDVKSGVTGMRWVRPVAEKTVQPGQPPKILSDGTKVKRADLGMNPEQWKEAVRTGIVRAPFYSDSLPAGSPIGGADRVTETGMEFVARQEDRASSIVTLGCRFATMGTPFGDAAARKCYMRALGILSGMATNRMTRDHYRDAKQPNPAAYLNSIKGFDRALRERRGHRQTDNAAGSCRDGGKVYKRPGVPGSIKYDRGSRDGAATSYAISEEDLLEALEVPITEVGADRHADWDTSYGLDTE